MADVEREEPEGTASGTGSSETSTTHGRPPGYSEAEPSGDGSMDDARSQVERLDRHNGSTSDPTVGDGSADASEEGIDASQGRERRGSTPSRPMPPSG